ncbi:MAG: class II aldolase/adducin family protein [Alphaproteobacteria bacterium]|nr:class II aldolase/adducin family protein [Alphaproteobacteria bacterium]MDE2012765.1 class II aldolase/adducin family protein [Alphaproteobacteria bacterium]
MLALETRQRIVDLCVALSRKGYFAGTGGNLAVRIDASQFAVTPSATDYFAMTADEVCVMRLADLKKMDGAGTPSVETGLHARVLRRRPDVWCSIHTHQPVASAAALLGKPITVEAPLLRCTLGPKVPLVGYMPSGTGLLAFLLGRALRDDANAYLLRNHGVLCCGTSIETALQTVDDLERLVRACLQQQIEARMRREPEHTAALAAVLATLGGA